MAHHGPPEMVRLIAQGLLAYPVTHFDPELAFDEMAYLRHFDWTMTHAPVRAHDFEAIRTGFKSSCWPTLPSATAVAVTPSNRKGRAEIVGRAAGPLRPPPIRSTRSPTRSLPGSSPEPRCLIFIGRPDIATLPTDVHLREGSKA